MVGRKPGKKKEEGFKEKEGERAEGGSTTEIFKRKPAGTSALTRERDIRSFKNVKKTSRVMSRGKRAKGERMRAKQGGDTPHDLRERGKKKNVLGKHL